jgi:hypothetical protein
MARPSARYAYWNYLSPRDIVSGHERPSQSALTADPRHRVWLYREPWRSAYLIALLGLFAWAIADLVRRVPDRYSHQHASAVLLTFGLLAFHLGTTYAPLRWQAWTGGVRVQRHAAGTGAERARRRAGDHPAPAPARCPERPAGTPARGDAQGLHERLRCVVRVAGHVSPAERRDGARSLRLSAWQTAAGEAERRDAAASPVRSSRGPRRAGTRARSRRRWATRGS